MASKIKLNEVVLTSPNGLVEKSISIGDDGVVKVSGLETATIQSGIFTSTVTAHSGTFSSVVCSIKYVKIGKKVTVLGDVNIITLGSATGALLITLPFVSETPSCGVGRDVTITGNIGFVTVGQNTSVAEIKKYDNNSILTVDGVRIWFELTYFTLN